MIDSKITLSGIINFDPPDKTKKHMKQSSWKKVAFVVFDDDTCSYYAWFLKKRFNLEILHPVRKPHVTFINDSLRDINGGDGSEEYRNDLWKNLKEKWDKKPMDVVLDLNPRSDGDRWWFNVPEDFRVEMHNIRQEIGLGRPYYGLHLTIGNVHPKYIEHSNYILDLLKNNYAY